MKEFCTVIIDYIKKPDTWVAIATIATSLFALFQTKKQIKISNKQQLFDRRIEKYEFLKDIITAYSRSQSLYDENGKNTTAIYANFTTITDIPLFNDIDIEWGKSLDDKQIKYFFEQLEIIKRNADEIKFIWNGNDAKLLSEFVDCYYALLKSTYLQFNFINSIYKRNESENDGEYKYEDEANRYMQISHLNTSLDNIEQKYQEIQDSKAIEKLAKSIKLN